MRSHRVSRRTERLGEVLRALITGNDDMVERAIPVFAAAARR